MDYSKLEPYVFYFAGGMSRTTMKPIHGGSRSIPGRVGARACKMGQALMGQTHKGKVSKEDLHKIILWLDCNSLQLGAFDQVDKQLKGELVWPTLDVDVANPQGIERSRSVLPDHKDVSALHSRGDKTVREALIAQPGTKAESQQGAK